MKQTYYRHKMKNLLVISKIVTIHSMELKQAFSSSGEAHDFWELVYVDAGMLCCRTESREVILKKGEIIFHKPNEHHVHLPYGNTAPHLFIASFECKSEAMRFFEDKQLTLDTELLPYVSMIIEEGKRTFDIPVSDPALKKMPLNPQPPIGGLQMIKNLLELFLIRLMRGETQRADADSVFLRKEEFDGRIASQIKEILHERISTALSMDELAGLLNYNKSYLFRQFKASTGQTVMSYFTELKIDEAKRLITTKDLSISQISQMLAFDTPNYFSKVFRRRTGISPGEYRRIHRRR